MYAKMRHVPLHTGAATFATLVYRCLSALLRTEKDKAREDELPVKQGIVNALYGRDEQTHMHAFAVPEHKAYHTLYETPKGVY